MFCMIFKVVIVKVNKLIIYGDLWLDDSVKKSFSIRAYILYS